MVYDKPEPIENLITWVYEEGSFVPTAKIIAKEKFSIVNDYIGRPVQVYSEVGELVWETDYDIYGGLKDLKGDRSFMPFRQLGQYEDVETGLYFNRHRYYSPDSGLYLSQDPLRLFGGSKLYSYVLDSNSQVDIFGLTVTPGQVGAYSDLVNASDVGDDLELHHIPQDKLGHLPRKDGIAVVMPKSEHAQTRTYKSKGRVTAQADSNRAFKDVLKDDLVDLRQIGGAKYDDSIKEIIKEYENKGMIKKGELTLRKIKIACK
ncbi:RHS repeat-associated core domain-containing protein [Flavobacterium sp. LS1R47]|uniref:RHS repeat-associated core domain-containing protein n=1 Tax=Flavobacterium frigoritolerans TaxID=2987686 RepID=A0A9X2ZIW9_9FLAO|nr:RHS repeat-associated core domain-containing protein [Flavobacterium frigoritolerans]MCV9931914.1 RHS repeat-associated core domain-containing protein [Flavobacterium frigoritolerans]